MIGYAGTGYRGMQITPDQPTIEGDLFKAMIAAGAISKANASDPKKSSLVRCARTDKGVHAAGNVISLKLIVEDDDVVAKINEHLPDQIRVWGIERTVGSFSCYQACDSRWYEYLIPTHSFLPPHPSSFLGKKLVELAEEVGDLDGHRQRQAEVATWWEEAEERYIKPVLDEFDDDVRKELLHARDKVDGVTSSFEDAWEESDNEDMAEDEDGADYTTPGKDREQLARDSDGADKTTTTDAECASDAGKSLEASNGLDESVTGRTDGGSAAPEPEAAQQGARRKCIEAASRRLRQAYIAAKATYRLSPQRLSRIKDTLAQFVGTFNHHNYTVRKAPTDPSARRHIKSFEPVVAPSSTTDTGTYLIGDMEWLSIKVHGQSFMMHQIRKMVGMAALVVRCGRDPALVRATLWDDAVIAVPKAPSLGLLLERPVFATYNEQRAEKFGRGPVSFDRYEREMAAFKEREIYRRIHTEEAAAHVFHTFFAQIDEYKNKAFLYLTSKGLDATGRRDVTTKPVGKGVRHFFKKRGGGTTAEGETAAESKPEPDTKEARAGDAEGEADGGVEAKAGPAAQDAKTVTEAAPSSTT
ncbi:MAG: hypothetical protein INR71_01975 [Terriglobus roseus]|nr:hypothetical protein [Terriglobus roseus]